MRDSSKVSVKADILEIVSSGDLVFVRLPDRKILHAISHSSWTSVEMDRGSDGIYSA